MMSVTKAVLLACVACLFAGCGEAADLAASDSKATSAGAVQAEVEYIDADRAADLLASGEVAVLDVRTAQEYDRGHIAGAVLLDFRAEGFSAAVQALPHDKPYVVYCASGGRSARALASLRRSGAAKIYHLDGGIKAWNQGQHPLSR